MDMKAFFDMSYGLFLLSALGPDGAPAGCTVNTVFQLTNEPPVLAVSLNRQSHTNGAVRAGGRLVVNILDQETPMALIGAFGFRSGRDTDKFEGVAWHKSPSGLPVLDEHLCGWLECAVTDAVELSTHTLFIARAVDGLRSGGGRVPPMTYEYYRQVKNGTVPKAAPHYIDPEKLRDASAPAAKWVCPLCGYEYDGSGGPFEALPGGWKCPLCGAPKALFVQK